MLQLTNQRQNIQSNWTAYSLEFIDWLKAALCELKIADTNCGITFNTLLNPIENIAAIHNMNADATYMNAIETLTGQFSGDWFEMNSTELNSTDVSECEAKGIDLTETTQTDTSIDEITHGSEDADDEVS